MLRVMLFATSHAAGARGVSRVLACVAYHLLRCMAAGMHTAALRHGRAVARDDDKCRLSCLLFGPGGRRVGAEVAQSRRVDQEHSLGLKPIRAPPAAVENGVELAQLC